MSKPIHFDTNDTKPSEPFITGDAKDVILAHVEVSLIPGTDIEISRGVCGEKTEMTLPKQPATPAPAPEAPLAAALASTGINGTTALILGSSLVAAGLTAFLLIRRRRRAALTTETENTPTS